MGLDYQLFSLVQDEGLKRLMKLVAPKYVLHYVCMYVCMVIYVRATTYSLDCHVGAMINRRLYRTFQSLVVHRTAAVTSTWIAVPPIVMVSQTTLGSWCGVPNQLTGFCQCSTSSG